MKNSEMLTNTLKSMSSQIKAIICSSPKPITNN
ncbi:rCG20784 [Rattus norvegicus]|uniref:RCG20784 n=1 Tax=Rattus norvegicus TaxID=10116 RepID=A6JED6_RAT|nr:rCG20784 [Rattus norvegicus]